MYSRIPWNLNQIFDGIWNEKLSSNHVIQTIHILLIFKFSLSISQNLGSSYQINK